MSRKRKYRFFSCDFETTVYEGQKDTEVWASAAVEFWTEDVHIFHSIGETFEFFKKLNSNIICYYHNLKFDGQFWLAYLLNDLGMDQAYVKTGADEFDVTWVKPWNMPNNSFQYSISDLGMWYSIKIMVNRCLIEIRDSYKLLPFSVEAIGAGFGTKHKKLNMVYEGYRYAGCVITPEEQKYIANDVLVVKEALEFMYSQGHSKLTIGSCCLQEFQTIIGDTNVYNAMFPNMYDIKLDPDVYGVNNAGLYIRRSYKGGWCYLAKGKEGRRFKNGTTADVNSLYPSMMHSESGNRYPIGKPHFWSGNFIPDEAVSDDRYFFVRIKTRFYIRDGMLPFLQVKGSFFYDSTVSLESSDVVDRQTGETSAFYVGLDGKLKDTRLTLTMTMTDYKLFLEHYHVVDFEILDGCWFRSASGIFDEYIDKYKQIKLESKGAMRTLAKLFLNNLYGKMASNTDSSFKVAYRKNNGVIGFVGVPEANKQPGYIPVGSAITSYARNFTIRAAQQNYYGPDKPGFIYADTDSIHCDLAPDQLRGVHVHDKNFCCWKLEACWDDAIFTRQKTYIEHITAENLVPVDEPFYSVKCAGMPEKCKQLFLMSMAGYQPKPDDDLTDQDRKFITEKKRTLDDFTIGLKIPGKLMPKRIKGGVVLVDSDYEMRP